MAFDYRTNTLYVVNFKSETISVIDVKNNLKIGEDIKVGRNPSAIAILYGTNALYVANYGDDTVSVIDVKNNLKIGEDIKVGRNPWAFGYSFSYPSTHYL